MSSKKRVSFTLADLKNSKVAGINQHAFDKPKKADKKYKQLPNMPCEQVQWMWGQLAWWSLDKGIEIEKEYKFHPERRWRFDFAIPSLMIGIEYNGMQSAKSRHTTLMGYTGDREKINAAQSLGWKVLEFTVLNYKKVISELEKTIENGA